MYFYAMGPQPPVRGLVSGCSPFKTRQCKWWASVQAVHKCTKPSPLSSHLAATATSPPRHKGWGMLFYATSHPFKVTVVRNRYLWTYVEQIFLTTNYLHMIPYVNSEIRQIIQLRIFMHRQNILNKVFLFVIA